MDIVIRNKWISLKGSSVVKDLSERDICQVEGKFWTFTRKKFVKTLEGEVKYVVRNKYWTLFTHKAFVLSPDEKEKVALIRRKVFSLHDRYFITSKFGNLEIKGNILGFDYHIILDGKEIGHVARKISLRDSFVLHLESDENWMFYLALVIAIDNITDQRNAEAAAAAS